MSKYSVEAIFSVSSRENVLDLHGGGPGEDQHHQYGQGYDDEEDEGVSRHLLEFLFYEIFEYHSLSLNLNTLSPVITVRNPHRISTASRQ